MHPALVALCLLISVAWGQNDPCKNHNTCSECLHDAANTCGWCSLDWHYEGGLTGTHCADPSKFRANCPGITSTTNCIQGWICHHNNNTCTQAAPGKGIPQSQCFEECGIIPPLPPTPSGPTFLCNQTSSKCYPAPKGEHGFNPQYCEEICKPVTPSAPAAPATPSAPSAPTSPDTCVCNRKDWKCIPVPAGTPGATSCPICANTCHYVQKYICDIANYTCQETKTGGYPKAECEAACKPRYVCDTSDWTCKVAKPPEPGYPLQLCEKECKPGNNTPGYLTGVWRGLQLNKDFALGEWDVSFNNNEIYIVGPTGIYFGGTTNFGGTENRRTVEISITNSTETVKAPVGSKLQGWYQFDGNTPENRFVMFALSAPGKMAPATWADALHTSEGYDFTLNVCEPLTHCQFTMRKPATAVAVKKKVFKAMAIVEEFPVVEGLGSEVDDPCEQYISCAVCLDHYDSLKCGWCSQPVIYPGHVKGGHCVKWDPKTNPFNCTGFRNYDCNDYECIYPQAQCVKVPVGHGTNKTTCEATCKQPPAPPATPTPLPPPPTPQVVACNHTSFQCVPTTPGSPNATSPLICANICHKMTPATPAAPATPQTPTPPMAPTAPAPVAHPWLCNHTTTKCHQVPPGTPGASGKSICEGTCTPAPPPPPPSFNGNYRGIQTDNKYNVGELDLDIKDGDYTLKLNGKLAQSGKIYLNGARGNLYVTSTQPAPKTVAAIYSFNPGITVDHFTVVMGKDEHDVPHGWDVPWIEGGSNGHEMVFIKLNGNHEDEDLL